MSKILYILIGATIGWVFSYLYVTYTLIKVGHNG